MASLPLTLALLLVAPAEAPPSGPAEEALPSDFAGAPPPAAEAEPAGAAPGADEEGVEGDREESSSGCPLLFGSSDARAANRALRERRLAQLARGEQILDIVHNEPSWREPAARRVTGLEVRSVEASPEGELVALVQVSEAFAHSCPPGEYVVAADDALGAEGQVLAVLEEGVLAELRGDLIFLRRDKVATAPRFRMIWRSDFGLNLGSGAAVASSGGGKAASPARATRAQARERARAAPAAEKRRAISTRRPQPRG